MHHEIACGAVGTPMCSNPGRGTTPVYRIFVSTTSNTLTACAHQSHTLANYERCRTYVLVKKMHVKLTLPQACTKGAFVHEKITC